MAAAFDLSATRFAPRLAMVAGEPSGDLLGGLLLGGLRARWPQLHSVGIGGPHMIGQGFAAWWPQHLLAVRGYVEVLPHLRRLLAIRRDLGDRLLLEKPDVFIGIDAPDFNFDLEARLKNAGIATVHYVSPSFWAWRAKKLEKLKRSADHVLCIFPFEPALLAHQGIAATYVGHPLASVIPMVPDRAAARTQLGFADGDTVLAILPGSRQAEINHLASRFFDAAALVRRSVHAIKIVVPALPALKAAIAQAAVASGVSDALTLLDGQSHTALAACDLSLLASGTATLEAALFKRPMVIAYHMPWLSWQIMRRKQLQPWVGLPNILCNEFVVPELLQDAATPQALADALLAWLAAPRKIQALEQRFATLHAELQRDTPRLACDVIQALCERKAP
jgi:lipid-A-disaccharide synthase